MLTITDSPITDAARWPGLLPGDIIYASCGYGANGGVVAFGEDEAWPIELRPGVSLCGYTNPVYGAPVMIAVQPSNPLPQDLPMVRFVDAPGGWSAPDPTAKLKGMYLVGGDLGVLVKAKGGGAVDAEIEEVVFSRNRTAVQVEGSGAWTLPVVIRDCSISATFPQTFAAADVKPFEVGIRLWSRYSQADYARVEADLINFQTVGSFASAIMHPIGKLAGSPEPCDLAGYQPVTGGQGNFTRIVEIGTRGNPSRLEYVAPPNPTKQDVNAVVLSVDGGVLDGAATSDSTRIDDGWDVGIYAVADIADSQQDIKFNYTSWFDITTNGTLVDNCRATGIYVQTNTDTRGHLAMNN